MNLGKIWSTALGNMQVQASRQDYSTWLRPSSLLAIDNGVATVGVPTAFHKEGLENRFNGMLRAVITDLVGFPVHVRVIIAPNQGVRAERHVNGREYGPASVEVLEDEPVYEEQLVTSNGRGLEFSPPSYNGFERRALQQLELSSAVRAGMLNSRYTFDRFIVGSSNRLASAACMAVADNPAQSYNPLFLYGGVGLGKTHLLHAIGNGALDRDPETSVMYVSSEKFTNDLINAIRRQQTEEFRIRYRSIDILLIDDIQFIAGKESTQEEFFHTFNALHSAGKQIVISSDKPPKAILTLEERLRSRFEWGLIVDVQLPDLETRTAILRAKAEQLSIHISSQVLDFLANRIQSNIRELEGCLNRVVAYAQFHGSDVTPEVASQALNELLDQTNRKKMTADAIINEVSDYYGVDIRSLKGRGRSRHIVVPRQVSMYLLRAETDSSLVEIGRLLGGRDHTTVMYGCEKITDELLTDMRLRQEVATIREKLYQKHAALD